MEEPDEDMAWGAWLHDAEEDSLTLAWAVVPEASVYEVQLRKEGADEWTSLSAKIAGTMLKKKNLDPASRYIPPPFVPMTPWQVCHALTGGRCRAAPPIPAHARDSHAAQL